MPVEDHRTAGTEASVVPFHQRIPSSYVYTPPQRVFSVTEQTIDEKSLPTMQSTDITMFGRPMMLMYFMAANPAVVLPLAPMRPMFGELSTYIPEASASPTTRGFCDLYFTYFRTVIDNRLRYAIDKLYPHVDIMTILDSRCSYVIPELERGPVPILEYIVRDAMQLFNPIGYIVTFLEQVVSHYRTLTTDDDRQAYRARVLEGSPLRDMYMLTHLYGLYMWDSRWAFDDKLHQLVHVFETITTEVFPNAFEQIVLKLKDKSEGENYRRSLKSFIFTIIMGIAPCFLHHYRPMREPQHFCMPGGFTRNNDYPIPADEFPALMETLRSAVMQCTCEYLEHPESFSTPPPLLLTPLQTPPQNGSSSDTTMVDIPALSPPEEQTMAIINETVAATPSPPTTVNPPIMSQLFLTLCPQSTQGNAGIGDITYNSDDIKNQIKRRLNGMDVMLTAANNVRGNQYQLPFKNFVISNNGITHLVRSIARCPPKDDPVYVVLSPIFQQLTLEVLDVMMRPLRSPPEFSYPSQSVMI